MTNKKFGNLGSGIPMTTKLSTSLKTRNFEDKITNQLISVQASKTAKNSKNVRVKKVVKGRSQKERFISKDSLNKTAPLTSFMKQSAQVGMKKREKLIKIKAYDSALNRIISWNSIHKKVLKKFDRLDNTVKIDLSAQKK